jgi:DNA invertase Pin-like site-specific DNA recombinase
VSEGYRPFETLMMTMVGYARVSSAGQGLDVQEAQLRAAGCEEIFSEKRTGTTVQGRAQLDQALKFVRKGDVLIVCRLDRLARSIVDLHRIVDQLTAKQVGFRCLQQGAIDTTKPEGRLMLNILGSFAEFETDLRKGRQREGIDRAMAAGVYRGRPPSVGIDQVTALKAEGVGPTEIAKRLGIGRASVYRALNRTVVTPGKPSPL